MAEQSISYQTELSDILIKQLDARFGFEKNLEDSLLQDSVSDEKIRNSKNSWISSDHWIAGFVWHYINKANTSNFWYDISHIDSENIQYTQYIEGQFYGWHSDTSIQTYTTFNTNFLSVSDNIINMGKEYCRKLSFSLQLSSSFEYEGGELQFMDDSGHLYCAPKDKGVITIFDSRVRHRVRKIKKGTRKSLVGWVMGPRWK